MDEYLTEFVLPTVAENNSYNLRNRQNISQMSSRLSMYKEYYFPSTIKLWNPLDLNLCQMPTFSSFKVNLRKPKTDRHDVTEIFLYRVHLVMSGTRTRNVSCDGH
jgi:hypothetical protein